MLLNISRFTGLQLNREGGRKTEGESEREKGREREGEREREALAQVFSDNFVKIFRENLFAKRASTSASEMYAGTYA